VLTVVRAREPATSSTRTAVDRIVPDGVTPRIWMASWTLRVSPAASVPRAQTTSRSATHPSGVVPPSDAGAQAKTPTGSVRRSYASTESFTPWFDAVRW
jgi:hypothetical protein